MLKDIWMLPQAPSNNSRPGFVTAQGALWILGKLLFHLIFPYLCVDLSLSEQVEHLSAAVHLCLALYRLAGKEFIPTGLYINVMIMVKNVIFCIAKAKADDPEGEFWIILLGTDRLEELFGILWTMVGNDTNLDILQLVSCLAGTTEISNILAKYLQWDHTPRRLKLPSLSRDSKEIPKSADHIKPASWRGNVKVKDVSLQTSWSRGRRIVEDESDALKIILAKLDKDKDVDILAPFGIQLFDAPLADDDIDESVEFLAFDSPVIAVVPNAEALETRIEVEDALLELATLAPEQTLPQARIIEPKVLVNGKLTSKARTLSNFSKFRKHAGSTDHLRHVQDIDHHIQNKTVSGNAQEATQHTSAANETNIIMVSDSTTTILSLDKKIWLCIGEINSIKVDGQTVSYLGLDMLCEDTVTISYQLLGLHPATKDDNPENLHEWRTYQTAEKSFTVPARLILPLNPSISKSHLPGCVPWFLFQGTVLVALAASLMEQILGLYLRNIPKVLVTKEFPYCERSGE